MEDVWEVAVEIVRAGIRMTRQPPGRKIAEPMALLLEDRAAVIDDILTLLKGLRDCEGTFDDAINALELSAANDRTRALNFRTQSYNDNN